MDRIARLHSPTPRRPWRVALHALMLGVPLVLGGMAQAQDKFTQERFQKGLDAFDVGAYREAYDIWLELARAGDLHAMHNLAQLLRLGLGVNTDLKQAFLWYKRAADNGFTDSQVTLGVMYLKGQGTERNEAEAAIWLRKAAERNDRTALYNLGLMAQHGLGMAVNLAEARSYFERAAKLGHRRAAEALAGLNNAPTKTETVKVEPTKVEPPKTEPTKVEAPQAESLKPEASKVELPKTESEQTTQLGITPQPLPAQTKPMTPLGSGLTPPAPAKGQDTKVTQSEPVKAKATTPEPVKAEAPKPEAVKSEVMKPAVTKPEPAKAEATQVEPPKPESVTPATVATAKPEAPKSEPTKVAAVPPAPQAPVKRELSTANSNSPNNQAGIQAYRAGDFARARQMWEAAANSGDAEAAFWLGRLYNRGEGVPLDRVQAYRLWRKAAAAGYEPASTAIVNLLGRMSPEELARAQTN